MRIVSSGLTDIGIKRSHNEDSFACSDDLGLYLVADGMGGHAAGEVASKTAMSIVFDFVSRSAHENEENWPFKIESGVGPVLDMLVTAVHIANRTIRDLSLGSSRLSGMGTTLVGVLVRDDTAHVVHVGDSRAYLLRNGQFEPLTRDHSWVEEQLQRNMITEEEARNHRFRNVITRALGNREELEVDCIARGLEPGDLFLLCTDGLTGMVRDEEIAEAVKQETDDLPALCQKLVDMANDAGGADNVTLVLLKVEED
ncbi:Stp1/IreP family PP2C-type Ser/Thr phosphatase [Candidatus Sumerlaeota bacterium]|nr:Stp1/IreP family PP2C-type Ser/Thr phosphatase [Candidatus Sumerlaeota bacterium]